MKKALLLFSCSSIFFACKSSKEDLLSKKWQAISVESPLLTEQMEKQKVFIDTIGTTTDADANEMLYGVRNMDSMRQEMKAQMALITQEQQNSVKNTWLDFNKNGTVAVNFGTEKPDTVSWYFEEDGALMLDEMKLKGTGSKVRMEVLALEKDKLQLRFDQNNFSSTVTLKPAN